MIRVPIQTKIKDALATLDLRLIAFPKIAERDFRIIHLRFIYYS